MNIKKIATITAALSASLLLNSPRLMAQDATTTTPAAPAAAPAAAPGGGGGQGGGRRGGFGGGGQNFVDMIKTTLKPTDDEWAVIQPLLQKVLDARTATRTGGFGGPGGGFGGRRGGNGGGPGGNGNAPAAATPAPSALATAATALSTALQSDATSPDDIKAKLGALRDARKQAQADLDAARANLQKVLTLRQEAVLVNMGILE